MRPRSSGKRSREPELNGSRSCASGDLTALCNAAMDEPIQVPRAGAHFAWFARSFCDELKNVFVQNADCWHHRRHTMLHRSPLFADRCGGALASEADDLWERCGLPLYILVLVTLVGEESELDGAEQAVPLGVVHVDASAGWRSEGFSCRTHTPVAVSVPSRSCVRKVVTMLHLNWF